MPVQRRRFSEEFKLQVIQEVLTGASQASVARRHSVSANTILQWLKSYKTGRVGGEATGAASAEVRPLRGFIITTDSKHHFPVYPNLYQNQWPDAPNSIWVADITYIRLPLGFVYLAVILDVFSRKIVGWALSRSLEATLVIEALQMALKDRKPPPGLIHHSDRGVQYASHEYTDLLKQHGAQIQRFIELVYNPKRLHSALGYRPPAEFELQYKQTQTAA
jgi:transposase InsO family protein